MAPSVQQKSQVFFPGQKTVSNRGVLLQPLDYLSQHGYKGALENIIASAFEDLHHTQNPSRRQSRKVHDEIFNKPRKKISLSAFSDR